jgi:hypothetical protein
MSPKNKGKFGQGKPAVELQDEFVSGVSQVADKLKPHVKVIAGISGVLVVILIGWYAFQYLNERAETKATALFRQALDTADRPVQEPEPAAGEDKEAKPEDAAKPEASPEAEGAATPDPAADPNAPFPSEQARAEAVLAPLQALREDYGSTDTARAARLLHASALYTAGRYQDAVGLYEEILADPSVAELAAEARVGLGYAQEALALASQDQAARQAGLEKALATFGAIQTKEDGPQREVALYHQARILAALGKREDAIASLKKASEIAPDSPLRNDIRQRLAQLSE